MLGRGAQCVTEGDVEWAAALGRALGPAHIHILICRVTQFVRTREGLAW